MQTHHHYIQIIITRSHNTSTVSPAKLQAKSHYHYQSTIAFAQSHHPYHKQYPTTTRTVQLLTPQTLYVYCQHRPANSTTSTIPPALSCQHQHCSTTDTINTIPPVMSCQQHNNYYTTSTVPPTAPLALYYQYCPIPEINTLLFVLYSHG